MEMAVRVTVRSWPSWERWIPRGWHDGEGASSSEVDRTSDLGVESEGETMMTEFWR